MKHENQNNLGLGSENFDGRQSPYEIRGEVLKMAANARLDAEKKSAEIELERTAQKNDTKNFAADKALTDNDAPAVEKCGDISENKPREGLNALTDESFNKDSKAQDNGFNENKTCENFAEAQPLFIDEQQILEFLSDPKLKKEPKMKKEKKAKTKDTAHIKTAGENAPQTDNETATKTAYEAVNETARETANETDNETADENRENSVKQLNTAAEQSAKEETKKAEIENRSGAGADNDKNTPSGEGLSEKPLKSVRKYDAETEKKASVLKRIRCYLFPVKGDPPKEIIRKIIFLLALVTFLGAAGYLVNYYSQGYVNENMVSNARSVYNAGSTEKNKDGMMIRFEELYRENPDIKGWIRIDGTKIDYPVYQTDNNDYYIDHDMSRSRSRYGAIFADADARIEKDGTSQNTVLYGHNMIDGSMFTGLLKYKELKFYRENPVINFDTLYASGQYKVFAVIITNVNAEDDNGYVFNYRISSFGSDIAFQNWVTNVKTRSIINTGIDVAEGDEILTLSTCSYEFDDARTVVFARKVRDGESRYIDTTGANVNKNVLYPQAYYDRNGGKKPNITDAVVSEKNASASGQTIKGYTEGGESYTTDNIDKSLISREVTVSSYVGMSLSAAIGSINDSGLYIQSIEYDGEDIPKNEVLKQSIKSGSKVKYGTGIVLKVSGTPANITVPKLVGLTLKKAEKTATKAGMTLSVVRMASSKKNDIVLMQSEKPKTVTENRSLVIYVSNGRNRVPSVKSLKTADAVKKLNDAGFKSKVVYIETSSPSQIGIVGGQSIEADSFQNVGKTVKIYVGKKPSKKDSSKASSSKKATSSKGTKSNASKVNSKASSVSSKTASQKPVASASQTMPSGSSQSVSSAKTDSAADSSAENSSKTESGGTSAE